MEKKFVTSFCAKTIIIPTFKRQAFLQSCLDSILKQVSEIEIIVVVNGTDESTVELLKNYDVTILITKGITPGEARNRGVEIARGEIIGFLDDDIELSENYFINLDAILSKYPKACVFGGPDQTFPFASHWEQAIGLTLTSPLATAKTSYRHLRGEVEVSDASEEYLILCNLWVKREVFTNEKFSFDNRLFRNEENVLLFQLKKAKKQLIYSPNLYVFHHRKGNLQSLIKAVSSSGYYRCLSFILYPSQISFHYMIPSLFLIYLLLLCFNLSTFFLLPIILYATINVLFSFRISLNHKTHRYLLRIIFIQLLINISYGLGFIYSLLRFSFLFLPRKNILIKRMRWP